MINISNTKHLNIILPNTNKALAEVLKNATPKQLKTLSEGKDLKSVMSTILKQSAQNSSTDKELLQLVKNNPTLKNLGDVSTTIKDLLNATKTDKNPIGLEKTFNAFVKDVKQPIAELKSVLVSLAKELQSSPSASAKGINSQIQELLSSALKNDSPKTLTQIASSVQTLTQNLSALRKDADPIFKNATTLLLNKLEQFVSTNKLSISPNIKEILSNQFKSTLLQTAKELKTLKHPNQAELLKQLNKLSLQIDKQTPSLKNLNDIATTIKDILNATKSDKNLLPLETKLNHFLTDIKDLKNTQLQQKLENSGVFLESRLKNVKQPITELKNILQNLAKELQTSPKALAKGVNSQIQELLSSALKNDSPKTLTQIASSVQTLTQNLNSLRKDADPMLNATLQKALEKIQHQLEPKVLTPENFKLANLKEPLEQISLQVSKSLTTESKGILGALEKIFAALKTIEQTATTPKASLEQLLSKNVPQEISKMTQGIKELIQKADPIFKNETTLLLNKLEQLASPKKLNISHNIKEILSSDFKATLLQTAEELKTLKHPNQTELLKQVDKLSLQIDNYQLISHLSNASSLYLPFSWDMLEEGNIQMRKDKDEKFYCDIDLKLKEYGELNIKMTLYEKNQLNLHIYSANEDFKTIIKENIPLLRSALIDTQITPREIRVFEPKKRIPPSPYDIQNDNLEMGFEVKA